MHRVRLFLLTLLILGGALAAQPRSAEAQIIPRSLEVDIMVAEVGDDTLVGHENNTLYVVKYDGFISEHKGFCVIGGNVDDVQGLLKDEYSEGLSQGDAVKLGLKALMRGAGDNSALDASTLEVCILDRSRSGRKFTRVPTDEVQGMLDA